MPETVTINLYYVWGVVKLVLAGFITCKELQYPIWRQGLQVRRGLQHTFRAYLRNAFVNPEWALVKLLAFLPVWLFTGKRHIDKFMPWRIKAPPPYCDRCGDKGRYYQRGFLSGSSEGWHECECQKELIHPGPGVICKTCLDTGKIGPDRDCPHCERRKRTNGDSVPEFISESFKVDNQGCQHHNQWWVGKKCRICTQPLKEGKITVTSYGMICSDCACR